MRIHADFEEFFRLLNAAKVDYVVVGGYAVVFHGYVRNTQDIDVLFRCTHPNIKSLRVALRQFGIPDQMLHTVDFADPGAIIRMGAKPVLIELINRVSGLTFAKIWKGRTQGSYGRTPVQYISLPDLLANKKASGRPKDLADVHELTERNR